MVLATKPVHEMRVMGLSGDEKITWDHGDDIQIKKARDKFAALLKQGYKAFVSKDIAGSKKGEEVKEFDATAERLILVPPMQGG